MLWVSLGAVLIAGVIAIVLINRRRIDRTADEVAKYLRDFIEGTGGEWDWDDFTSIPIADPELERIRNEATLVKLPAESLDQLRELLRKAEALARR